MTIDIPLSIEKKSEDEDCEEVENEDERGVIDDDDTPTLLPKGSSKPTPTLTPTPTPTLVPKFIPVWDCLCRGGDDDAPTYQTHIIQTLTGSAIIFAIERSIWAFGEYIIHSPVPSAPLGMMFIFIALFASHTVNPAPLPPSLRVPAPHFFTLITPIFSHRWLLISPITSTSGSLQPSRSSSS